MAAKSSFDLHDNDALTMLVTCGFDLLAQTEAQHRTIALVQRHLQRWAAEWRTDPPTSAGRKEALTAITRAVSEMLTAIRTQRLVAIDMQQTVSALQARGRSGSPDHNDPAGDSLQS